MILLTLQEDSQLPSLCFSKIYAKICPAVVDRLKKNLSNICINAKQVKW